MKNSFGSRSVLQVGDRSYTIFRLDALDKNGIRTTHLPFSLRILLENLLRTEDGKTVTADDVRALAGLERGYGPDPGDRLQPQPRAPAGFHRRARRGGSGRHARRRARLGGKAAAINPIQPAELVIDHSVQVDEFGTAKALDINAEMEFQRNQERYAFLRWGQSAFRNLKIVPPETGICHQVNLEFLARVVFSASR